MRKTTILLLAGICSIGYIACKKSKNTTTPDPVLPAGIFAKINGVPWTGQQMSISSISGTGTGDFVEITGYDSTGKTIDLRILNFMKKGTFSVPQANDSIFYSIDYGALSTPQVAKSGSISIEIVNDTAVGGTFSFTTDSVTVTEGTFKGNY